MQIEVKNIDVLAFEGDGLILPTLSDGVMQEGLAARVRELVGDEIEAEVTAHAPIAVGAALVTDAPNLNLRKLIHVPLLEKPGLRVGVENIRRATRAGLLAADRFQLQRIALPGMGYGEIGVPVDEAARAMIDEIIAFRRPFPLCVVLMDTDEEMIDALTTQLTGR